MIFGQCLDGVILRGLVHCTINLFSSTRKCNGCEILPEEETNPIRIAMITVYCLLTLSAKKFYSHWIIEDDYVIVVLVSVNN